MIERKFTSSLDRGLFLGRKKVEAWNRLGVGVEPEGTVCANRVAKV